MKKWTTPRTTGVRQALNNNVFIPRGIAANDRASLLGHTVRTNEQNYSLRRSDTVSRLRKILNTSA